MGRLPDIYLAIMDVQRDYLENFKSHFVSRHAPDLIAAGFHSAQSYESEVGEPFIWNVYEIPGPAIFLAEQYRGILARDPRGPEILTKVYNRSNTIYEQVARVNVPESGRGVFDSCLTALRLDVAEAATEEFIEWYTKDEFVRLRSRPGFVAGRLCRQNALHPKWPSKEPAWVVVKSWTSLEGAKESGAGVEVVGRHEGRFHGSISRVSYNLLRRLFGLVAERGESRDE